jgi:hypothetical protein
MIQVTPVDDILEQLRADLVKALQAGGFAVPPDARVAGNHFQAVAAWQRVFHRRVSVRPRKVQYSPELIARALSGELQQQLQVIRAELERGSDLTHRLTRQFYRTRFNDFLFNNFGIQHFHLGPPGTAKDTTGRHFMAGGGPEVVFAVVADAEAYLIDVADHCVFESAAGTKRLLQIVLRSRPDFLESRILFDVVGADLEFEDAFRLAKGSFATCFELDGTVLLTGGTVMDGKFIDGRRAPSTSVQVIRMTDYVLNSIVWLTEHITSHSSEFAERIEALTGHQPTELDLEVVGFGSTTILKERLTNFEFVSDGADVRLQAAQTSPYPDAP